MEGWALCAPGKWPLPSEPVSEVAGKLCPCCYVVILPQFIGKCACIPVDKLSSTGPVFSLPRQLSWVVMAYSCCDRKGTGTWAPGTRVLLGHCSQTHGDSISCSATVTCERQHELVREGKARCKSPWEEGGEAGKRRQRARSLLCGHIHWVEENWEIDGTFLQEDKGILCHLHPGEMLCTLHHWLKRIFSLGKEKYI